VSQLVFPVIVAVLGAVLVTAFTPLGASLRELLFHTRATVAGSVSLDGKPAVSVHLKLDGVDLGNTDTDGRFLLTDVGKGQHRIHLELIGAKPRDEVFSVASGQTALQIGNLEMEPLVRLAYTPFVHLSSAQEFDYDITLWIIGDPDVLSRIKSVSYTLPTPLSSRPVSGAGASHDFCYRQTGSISLQDSPLGTNSPVLALAVVDLGAGKQFQISAPAGTTQPPGCPAHQAGSAAPSGATSAPSQQPPPAPGQPSSSPTASTAPSPTVPSVIGDTAAQAQQTLNGEGFQVTMNFDPAPPGQPVPPGTVWNQSPAANTPEPSGSSVQIFVQPQVTTSPSPSATPAA
jgi:PASTA domain